MIRIILAPMEGITNFIFRRVYLKHFKGVDESFTPFITANQTHSFKKKEKLELSPYDESRIPQLLTNDAQSFIWALKAVKEMGYREVNLNLGCPSPTVTSRGRGAGMLADKEKLRAFFDETFAAKELPDISVKTRAGVEDPSEAGLLAELYSGYPFKRIILHPRLLKDLYKGKVRTDCFTEFYERIPHDKLVFNGDINTPGDAKAVEKSFPGLYGIMIGRGILRDPFLPERIKGIGIPDDKRIAVFLDELWDDYEEYLSGEKDVLYKMKEIWSYLYLHFPDGERILKDIRKSQTKAAYRAAIGVIR